MLGFSGHVLEVVADLAAQQDGGVQADVLVGGVDEESGERGDRGDVFEVRAQEGVGFLDQGVGTRERRVDDFREVLGGDGVVVNRHGWVC